MEDKRFVDTNSARTPEYRETLKRIAEEKECPAPFCLDQADYHRHPIELEGRYWKVTRNSFNYQDARIPFLIVHREHIENFTSLKPDAWAELQDIVGLLVAKHDIRGATLMLRFGDKPHTGASVTHLHAHLVAGYPRGEESKPIMAVVGFGKPHPKL